jgi:hypothetical protein
MIGAAAAAAGRPARGAGMRAIVVLGCAAMAAAGCSGGKAGNEVDPDNPLGLKQDTQSAVAACISPEDQLKSPQEVSAAKRQEIIGCVNAHMAEQIRPQLPVDVDHVTQLVDITSEGPMLTYHYRVSMKAGDLRPGVVEEIESQVRRTACAQPQMRQTIGFGGAYGYRWDDREGERIHSVRIDSCDRVSRLPRRPL